MEEGWDKQAERRAAIARDADRGTARAANAGREPEPRARCSPRSRPCPRSWGLPLLPPRSKARDLSALQLLQPRQKQTPAGITKIRWNERSKRVKPSGPAKDTKTPFPGEEEMPAFPSAKAKIKLPADVKGQQFPLHPCHVQVTRQALGASRLVRIIHLTQSNALHLDIRKQTLRISRTQKVGLVLLLCKAATPRARQHNAPRTPGASRLQRPAPEGS